MQENKEMLGFIELLNRLPDQEYIYSVIAYGTAPTIREKKPSSLMSFPQSGRNLYDLWHAMKWEVCRELRLEFLELSDSKDSIKVLF